MGAREHSCARAQGQPPEMCRPKGQGPATPKAGVPAGRGRRQKPSCAGRDNAEPAAEG